MKFWVIMSVVIGIVAYTLVINLSPITYSIKEISLDGRGGECPEFGVYDNAGVVHSIFIDIVSYIGPAPLYYVDPQKINAKEFFYGCYEFPQQIPTSFLSDGVTLYPLDVDISFLNNNWIGAGESTILSVESEFSNFYSEHSFAIPLSEGKEREVTYELHSTNFEFSPSNENTPSATISLHRPIKQQWVISPKSNALGEQYLGVSVIIDKHILPIIVNIDVRPLYGLKPSVLALLAASGSGVIGLLTILSQSLGVWEKFKKLNNQNARANKRVSQDEQIKNDDPWNSLSYRREKIKQAKNRELLERKLKMKR